jgi:hypothetical protein
MTAKEKVLQYIEESSATTILDNIIFFNQIFSFEVLQQSFHFFYSQARIPENGSYEARSTNGLPHLLFIWL